MSEMERSQLVLQDQAPPAEDAPTEEDKWNNLKDRDTINKEITDLEAKIESDIATAQTALDVMETQYADYVKDKVSDFTIAAAFDVK